MRLLCTISVSIFVHSWAFAKRRRRRRDEIQREMPHKLCLNPWILLTHDMATLGSWHENSILDTPISISMVLNTPKIQIHRSISPGFFVVTPTFSIYFISKQCLSLLLKWKLSRIGLGSVFWNDWKGTYYKFILSWIFPVILYTINTLMLLLLPLVPVLSFCHLR